MTPKLYKAADVCVMAHVQPYVLRSWEKEFPGIGVQTSPDGPRLYRQSDIDQVLRIKQLVFGEGLTLAGARRKLEESAPPPPATTEVDDTDVAASSEEPGVVDALTADARTRIASVREGLRSILSLLSSAPGSVVMDDYALEPPPGPGTRRESPAGGASRPQVVKDAGAESSGAKRRRASA